GVIAGVVGATSVRESSRLAQRAQEMNLLCFVANNNPAVWQRRRNVFHIGLPSSQTACAVASLLRDLAFKHVLLVYDDTDFQRRVASSTKAALEEGNIAVVCTSEVAEQNSDPLPEWRPDLIYIVFSSELRALSIARRVRRSYSSPLLFGRSLLRESFLSSLDKEPGEVWFVDMFRRGAEPKEHHSRFAKALAARSVDIPTANHGFGWDGMSFCARALEAAAGDPARAAIHLESGAVLEGVTGACSFAPDNHNGRDGFGPTCLTRWSGGRLEVFSARD
ncbi:MAG TPA: hypothetical protein VIB79_28280, partial [Candidatus Binatia bacterium]